MWCIVSQPNSVILEVEVDPKSKGQECLEKVCQFLGISKEEDYFGLKFHISGKTNGSNGCSREAWLNLRNQIGRQMVGLPPFRLALRVKFWVPPHLLLQEATRHQFYLHARRDLSEGRLKVEGLTAAKMVALVAQAELGDLEVQAGNTSAGLPASSPFDLYSCLVPNTDSEKFLSSEFLAQVVNEHRKLKGMKRAAAEYWLLKEVSKLEHFGEEEFRSHRVQDNVPVTLGIGPHGLSLYDAQGSVTQRIPYTAITSASSRRRLFYLGYISSLSAASSSINSSPSFSLPNGNQRESTNAFDVSQPTQTSSHASEQQQSMAGAAHGPTEASLCLKLDSVQAASCLYRCTTEKHAFYSCETVRSAVTSQFVRDLKGTIASIFNEDTSLGKKYVFDIRRTCREVYDNARRALYQSKSNVTSSLPQTSSSSPNTGSDHIDPMASFPFPEFSEDLNSPDSFSPFSPDWEMSSMQLNQSDSCKDCDSKKCKEQKEQLTRLMEAMSCRICMDRPTNTAFFPCGHVICCEDCARRCLPICPVCRAPVTSSKQVFLPVPFGSAPNVSPAASSSEFDSVINNS